MVSKSVRVVLCNVNIYREGGGREQVRDTYTVHTQQSRSAAGDFLAAALSQCLDSDCAGGHQWTALDSTGQSVVDTVTKCEV